MACVALAPTRQLIQRPHPAGGLDLHVRAGMLPHELEVRHRRALVAVHAVGLFDEAVPGARLDERDPLAGADVAQADDVRALQVVVLEDDLERAAARRDEAVDGLDLVLDVVPLAAEGLADVGDHVDLGRAAAHGLVRLSELDGVGRAAVREADDGADEDVRAGEGGGGGGHGVRLDAGGGEIEGPREGEAGRDVGVGEGGVQEGVVDELGELGEGDGDGVGGHGFT
ncbi:hypothetical protein TOPH_08563 [Tolypocladium ophioglossoides CBS 100239]|uniref:Uncharacterized protein n=1 Tax=Tolypocladium ophioglossoides (strain CBS 100239) TaxID=1163406 RepID=A0A0L0MY92_TOLOC|nr:hypothetical protein TOPH_08563 [Tolypocladium ophioglossoides CBS 100239]